MVFSINRILEEQSSLATRFFNTTHIISMGLVLAIHLIVKIPRPGDSEGTFSVSSQVATCYYQWPGNYFRTGGQDRERQSREREIKFFAKIGVFFIPKTSVLLKEKKVFAGFGVSFCPKNKRSLRIKKRSSPD